MRQFKPDPYSEIDGECDYGDDDRVNLILPQSGAVTGRPEKRNPLARCTGFLLCQGHTAAS